MTVARRTTRQRALAVCIPTWNHADLLERLLDDVIKQHCEDVEIVVADNGSTDNTRFVVAQARKLMPITYVRAERNEGFDANVRRCVAHASARNCWLIGDDDRLYRGAIARMLDTLTNRPGAIIVGDVQLRDRDGTPGAVQASTRWPDYSTFWLDEPGSVARYLSKAETVRAAFPYLSNVVFPREAWPLATAMRWDKTSYTHLFALWTMALAGVPVVTRARIFVHNTIGNHHHRDRDTVAQTLHSMRAADQLAQMVPHGVDRVALRRVWALWYTPAYIEILESRCHHEPQWPFARAWLTRNVEAK